MIEGKHVAAKGVIMERTTSPRTATDLQRSTMRTSAERHSRILKLLEAQGYVTVSDLSRDFSVSEATIRRDLRNLEQRSLLYRTHGGATPTNHRVYDRPVSEKAKQHADEKRRIGRAAADLVEPHDSIILASGTTMIQVAKHLHGKADLTIICGALNVAIELLHLPNVEIFMLGGMVRLTATSVGGPTAEQMMRQHSCSKLFLGVDGFDMERGLTTSNVLEAHLNQQMIAAARQTIVITDSSKFGLCGFSHICEVDKIDTVITDVNVMSATLRQLHERNIDVITV